MDDRKSEVRNEVLRESVDELLSVLRALLDYIGHVVTANPDHATSRAKALLERYGR